MQTFPTSGTVLTGNLGSYAIEMEALQRTLRESRLLEESRVLGWAIQILDALDYLHTSHNRSFTAISNLKT